MAESANYQVPADIARYRTLALGVGGIARKGAEALSSRNAEIVRALVANGGTGSLPAISQTPRAVIEALIRRGGLSAQ